jgi:hypothetical protein
MKNILIILALVTGFTQVKAGTIVVDGRYQGKNLYVQNAFSESGVGFCVTEVRVNGELTTDEWNSSAFEVDFLGRQLKLGDPVKIEIRHKDACKYPVRVLNPEVLNPTSTFKVSAMKVDKITGELTWSTTGETGELNFIVEQYRWNKWVKVGTIKGKGIPTKCDYNVMLKPHSGPNKVRVKQIDYSGPRYSTVYQFRTIIPTIQFAPKKVEDEIIFTDDELTQIETMYEIYDQFGNLVLKGFSSKVNASSLKKGVYYLNFDAQTSEFIKR